MNTYGARPRVDMFHGSAAAGRLWWALLLSSSLHATDQKQQLPQLLSSELDTYEYSFISLNASRDDSDDYERVISRIEETIATEGAGDGEARRAPWILDIDLDFFSCPSVDWQGMFFENLGTIKDFFKKCQDTAKAIQQVCPVKRWRWQTHAHAHTHTHTRTHACAHVHVPFPLPALTRTTSGCHGPGIKLSRRSSLVRHAN